MKEIKCLVLTPFSDSGLRINEALKQVFSEYGIRVMHPADLTPGEYLLEGVSELFNQADFIIADVSDLNPNIIYDIGLAKGTEIPVIILADKDTKIPMSLGSIPSVRYKKEHGIDKDLTLNIVSALVKSGKLPHQRTLKNPFEYSRSESLSLESLAQLFIPPPYFELICRPETVVLIGTRGCGKTMVLQMMRFARHQRTEYKKAIEPRVAGFYVNFNTAFRYMGAENTVLSNGIKMTIYFNLLFLQAFADDLDILRKSGKISESEEQNVLTAVAHTIGIPKENLDSLSMLSSEVTRYIQLTRGGSSLESNIEGYLASWSFLGDLATSLCEYSNIFSGHNIAYLLDDYASDWLPEEICQALNRVVFLQPTTHCSFKIATIPGRQNFSLGTSSYAQCHYDYTLVNMNESYEKFPKLYVYSKFLQEILDKRLRLVSSPLDSKSLFDTEPPAKNIVDYSGVEGIARLCTDDYRIVINVCYRMIADNPSLDQPIPRYLQNLILRSYSTELLHSLKDGLEWGEYAFQFLTSMMTFSKESVIASKKTDKTVKPERNKIFGGFVFEDFKNLSPEAEKKLLGLIRLGVLLPSNYKGNQRFIIKRMFFPAFEVPVTGSRYYLVIKSIDSEKMFADPNTFWREKIKKSYPNYNKNQKRLHEFDIEE